MKQYKKTNARGRSVSFLPNTYHMSVDHERRAFERLVTDGVAKLAPWIATIKKYSRKKIIPSHAKLLKRYQSSKMTSKQIMQKYICDQMIWNHRQFVVRIFWLVRTLLMRLFILIIMCFLFCISNFCPLINTLGCIC
jgi:hypothetical protein